MNGGNLLMRFGLRFRVFTMPSTLVTTSWDDAQNLDLRLGGLLAKHGLTGTFYAARDYMEPLGSDELRRLAEAHEVGAHTLTHADLSAVPIERAREEVVGSKAWLEDVLGREVPMFCYPMGRFTPAVKMEVEHAGFAGARTVEPFVIEPPADPFEMGTTVHVYPHPLRRTGRFAHILSPAVLDPMRRNAQAIRRLNLPVSARINWFNFASTLFDAVRERGGVFHLWGHAWEIEKYGMWKPFERLLAHNAATDGVRFVTNGELLKKISGTTERTEDTENDRRNH